MKQLRVLYIMAAVIIGTICVVAFSIIFYPKIECKPGDSDCLADFNDLRDSCIPSTSIVTVGNETNYIKMRIVISKEGDRCVSSEEVIEDSQSNIARYDITGRNITCNLTEEEMDKFGPHACEGSLIDYVMPSGGGSGSGGGGDGFGDGTPYTAPPNFFCTVNDMQCKAEAVNHIFNCYEAEIEGTEEIFEAIGNVFLTVYVNVGRGSTECDLFYRVINAVNLPPEIPPQIIGMNMTCTIPISQFPIDSVEETDCSGPLIEYFELIYH